MSLEEHKALSRRAIEMWGSGNDDRAEALFTADYVNHQESDVEGGVTARGLSEWQALVAGYHEAFSDSEALVERQIAEGDQVASRFVFTATNTGAFLERPPTNARLTWSGVQIDRFEGGKIAESWVDWDKYTFFQGLGLVKAVP
ncbi:MAG: ester cyclase [Pseudomonadota bacterium]